MWGEWEGVGRGGSSGEGKGGCRGRWGGGGEDADDSSVGLAAGYIQLVRAARRWVAAE